jgi:hypothetical protein
MERISNKLMLLLFAVLWITVIAVADMNWPNHMGGSDSGIVNSILNLI